ncbi:hypothetical protein ACH4MN_31950 [Streptomyces anulatus]
MEKRAAGAVAGGRPKAVGGEKAQQQRRVGLPADLGLRVALGHVSWLWERLSGWQQDQVVAAAKAELSQLAGLGVAAERALRLLADRLADRLEETGGEALVDKPFGWLIGRGLVWRPSCSDRRCDDGTRLDTGSECENYGNVVHIRRARRARTAAEIDRELPHLGDDERRRVLEERLRGHAAAEAEDTFRELDANAHASKWNSTPENGAASRRVYDAIAPAIDRIKAATSPDDPEPEIVSDDTILRSPSVGHAMCMSVVDGMGRGGPTGCQNDKRAPAAGVLLSFAVPGGQWLAVSSL